MPAYLLFPELCLENIGSVPDGPHFLQPSFHSRQPDLHLVPFGLVSLTVPEHRVQLRLPLHHFRVHFVPVLPQLRNCNNNRTDVPFSYDLCATIFAFVPISSTICTFSCVAVSKRSSVIHTVVEKLEIAACFVKGKNFKGSDSKSRYLKKLFYRKFILYRDL